MSAKNIKGMVHLKILVHSTPSGSTTEVITVIREDSLVCFSPHLQALLNTAPRKGVAMGRANGLSTM